MRITNPLAASAQESRVTRFARLHVLLRDAYYSSPEITALKLESLEALRLAAVSSLPLLDTTEHGSAGTGVRLIERLRFAISVMGEEMNAQQRRRIVLDLLFSAAPPAYQPWARSPEPIIADIAGVLGLSLSSADLVRLVRHHRSTRKALWSTVRTSGVRAVTCSDGGPQEAVADALRTAMGLCPEAALASAVALVRGEPGTATTGISGGVILDRLCNDQAPALDRFVGTALARTSLPTLTYHLASIEVACLTDPDVRTAVSPVLQRLAADLSATLPRDDDEAKRLTAGAKLTQNTRQRIEQRHRLRFGDIVTSKIRPSLDSRDSLA